VNVSLADKTATQHSSLGAGEDTMLSRASVVLLFLGSVLGLGSGCGLMPRDPEISQVKEGTPRREKVFWKRPNYPQPEVQAAIYRILDQDKRRFQTHFDKLTQNSQPSELVAVLEAYCGELQAEDLSGTPETFAQAFGKYAQACRQLQAKLKLLPDHYQPGEFMMAIKALYGNKTESGKLLGGDILQAFSQINRYYADLYEIASKNGLEVQE